MLALLLTLPLSASPAPRALPDSDLVVFAPRLDKLEGVNAFLTRAGERSVLLRPSSYRGDFHPLLQVDPLRRDSLEAAGIDAAGPATVNVRGDTRVTCTLLSDPARFEKRAAERLQALGARSTLHVGRVTVQLAQAGRLVPGGTLRLGREACGVTGTSLTSDSFRKLAAWLSGPALPLSPSPAALPGALFLAAHRTVLALAGDANTLVVNGRSHASGAAVRLTAPAPTAAAGVKPSGLSFVRLHAEPAALARTARAQTRDVCRACTGAAWDAFFAALTPSLTGELLARLDRVETGASLATAEGRFSALKQAVLLELSSPGPVQGALEALARDTGLSRNAAGDVQVPLASGLARLGVRGRWLVLSNDAAAAEAVAAVSAAPQRLPAHALEATLDPKLAARALRQISLLDVLANPMLAGLFAASTELGELLSVSDSVRLWAQPDVGSATGTRFELTWALPAR